MCGIAGFSRFHQSIGDEQTLAAMGQAIFHRGPDAGGEYLAEGVGLAHRRLSIIDLSAAGNQPMHAHDGRYVIVFNGEIYNFQPLRAALAQAGYPFRTHTDTEVILALYARHGRDCLRLLNGMFAFAIWDTQAERLFLARDRIGKKPLYYTLIEGDIIFASELKAMLRLPQIQRRVRLDALHDYFAYQYVPDPKTIFEGIHKLAPAHWLEIDARGVHSEAYWDVPFGAVAAAESGGAPGAEASGDAARVAALREQIAACTARRMIADVPLGAFLSGGVDSSGIVATMCRLQQADAGARNGSARVDAPGTAPSPLGGAAAQTTGSAAPVSGQTGPGEAGAAEAAQQPEPIITCSIGFDEERFNETEFARQVAEQYGTRHHELTVHENVPGQLEDIARFFDEPFADPSLVPTFFVSKLAREKVTVAIAGDGGDEVFAGYEKYSLDAIENRWRQRLPRWLRRGLPLLARPLTGSRLHLLRRTATLLNTLGQDPAMGFYLSNAQITDTQWQRITRPATRAALGDYHPSRITTEAYHRCAAPDHLARILYTDMKTYLPGDILVKVDRMSMANSLEVRAPLLDYELIEQAARLPSRLKFNNGEKKYILKEAFKPDLPEDILYRRKMGFSVPLAQWLRGEIRELAAERLLQRERGLRDYFEPEAIATLWQEHQRGEHDHATLLWSLLMFQLWWDAWMEGDAAQPPPGATHAADSVDSGEPAAVGPKPHDAGQKGSPRPESVP